MDGKSFVKLLRDSKLLDHKSFTSVDADLTFATVKPRGDRRIDFAQFTTALTLCARKKGCSVESVAEQVQIVAGPVFHGTEAEATRFFDDKSTWTGVHANGGPSTIDLYNSNDLSRTLDRSRANVRGVKL